LQERKKREKEYVKPACEEQITVYGKTGMKLLVKKSNEQTEENT